MHNKSELDRILTQDRKEWIESRSHLKTPVMRDANLIAADLKRQRLLRYGP